MPEIPGEGNSDSHKTLSELFETLNIMNKTSSSQDHNPIIQKKVCIL
jgi:hypothetical protein